MSYSSYNNTSGKQVDHGGRVPVFISKVRAMFYVRLCICACVSRDPPSLPPSTHLLNPPTFRSHPFHMPMSPTQSLGRCLPYHSQRADHTHNIVHVAAYLIRTPYDTHVTPQVGSAASADACLKGDVGSRATKLCKVRNPIPFSLSLTACVY